MSNTFSPVTQTFVSNGTAMPAAASGISSITSGVLGVYGANQTQVIAAPTITTDPKLAIYLGYADGSVKKSNVINGAFVTRYNGRRYQADSRDVWALGYDRKAATGLIEVANDTDYTFVIGFKFDKQLYSERPLDIRFNFRSSASATEVQIAAQIAKLINDHPGVKKDVSAIIVGNGNSAVAPTTTTLNGVTYNVYGGNGATHYGVEITGKDIAQFQNTSFIARRPYFVVTADRTTGFGLTTTVSQINAMDLGVGTYDQVYNMENFDYGTEGVLNRRLWPIPSLEYKATSTLTTSSNITGTTGNVTTVINSDLVTVATSTSILAPGMRIDVNGVAYEIKYIVSATTFVITAPASASYGAAANLKMKLGYSVIDIQVTDNTVIPTGVVSEATKLIRIAFPAIDASGAYNSVSALGVSLKTLFDSYMASTPRSLAPITI